MSVSFIKLGDAMVMTWRARSLFAACALAVLAASGTSAPARAEALLDALASAYRDNPELAAERAALRATDENLPQALAGWRPTIAATGTVARSRLRTDPVTGANTTTTGQPKTIGVTLSQNLFAGFRTVNSTKQAEALINAGREALKNVEQIVLFDAVQAYMDVVRDGAIVRLRKNNLSVLREQLRATQDRFDVGEITRTDIAQAEFSVAEAMSDVAAAEAALNTSQAIYERVIGHAPNALAASALPADLLPASVNQAIAQGDSQHPAVKAAIFAEQAAAYSVDVTTGELLPSLSVEGSVARTIDPSRSAEREDSASIVGRLSVPIYQRGEVSSRVRQAKQTRAQRRLEIDLSRRRVRAAVVAAWGEYRAAHSLISSAQARIKASRVAFDGVTEEARVGQRTTLDLLDARRDLVDAEVELVTAQRDRVVAAYALLSAMGKLNAQGLGLRVNIYDPFAHYSAVRNKWFGLSSPE